MDENVAKAVDRLTANIYDTDCTAYRDAQTIRAHLLAREAEVDAVSTELRTMRGEFAKQFKRAERAEALLREVVAVAVTQLFDTHRTDVEATFSLAELQSMVELTEPLMEANTRVEAIYRQAFDFTAHLSENSRG